MSTTTTRRASQEELWRIPKAGHTGGFVAQPAEYERRVVGFFDRALLGRGGAS